MTMLAYGAPRDAEDEYLRMSESTSFEAMYRFCTAVMAKFWQDYLRGSNEEEIARIIAQNEARWFLGMLRSIDYMHWSWKNYPFAWEALCKGNQRECIVVLEAVKDYDL
jgi:hypothetical protein